MSVMSNPAPASPTLPQPPLPGVVPPSPKRSSFVGFALIILVVLGVSAAAYFVWLKPKPQQGLAELVSASKTAKAFVGPLARTVRVAGQTSARGYATIVAPRLQGPDARSSMILLKLAPSGSRVKKGEVVVQIDPQSAVDRLDDLRESVQQARNSYDKTKANQAVEWENLQQTMRVAKANWDKAIKDAQAAEVQTVNIQELLKLSVEESSARYKQQEKDLANQKISEEAAMRISTISLQQNQLHYEQGQRNIEKFTIRTPIDGLAVTQTTYRNGTMTTVALGDQVSPGSSILKVVDPDSMQVEAVINQTEAMQLRIGQQVRVGLDAFPDLTFPGKVYSIGALAVGNSTGSYYLRNVPVRIAIEGSDPRLIPDLSAFGDVTVGKAENVVQVPRSAVRSENGQPYVFVKAGQQSGGAVFEKRPVKVGMKNGTHAAILEGLKEGEEVRVD